MDAANLGQQFKSTPTYSGPGLARPETGGWAAHAIGDNNTFKGDEPGLQWGRYTALVPVHQLLKFREYDRTGAMANNWSKDTINSIANDVASKGPQGLNESVHLNYDHDNKWGVLVEGNHRIAAAVKAGVTHIPVTIHARGELGDYKDKSVGAPLHMDTRLREEHFGFHPSIVHPGNFQEFEGAR